MGKIYTFFLVVTLLACMITPGLFAQHNIKQSTFGNGGGVFSNGNYQMAVTVGQTVTGSGSNAMYKTQAGVWFQLGGYLTSVEQIADNMPTEFRLDQNYPNPFNPTTTITFAVPKQALVTIKLYNMLGREIASLVNEELPIGIHKFVFDAEELPTGIYLYRMHADDFMRVRKLMLVK